MNGDFEHGFRHRLWLSMSLGGGRSKAGWFGGNQRRAGAAERAVGTQITCRV